MTITSGERVRLAALALKGLSVGDAFGELFFGEEEKVLHAVDRRIVPPGSWEFTDDTVMAIAVFEQLEKNGGIDQDELIRLLVDNHQKDPKRGYGATARRMLREISEGGDWRTIVAAAFEGMGSMGNGAAMRAAPVGAYFFDDLTKTVEMARLSATVTHTHIDGVAGAVAVSVAAALATQLRIKMLDLGAEDFIRQVAAYTPDSDTKSKILRSLTIPYEYHMDTVRAMLGNGVNVSSPDTVPFCIWCAAHHLTNFEESLWKAVSILGDRDTICAIVGGITILSSPEGDIPAPWLRAVEDVDKSVFRNTKKKDN